MVGGTRADPGREGGGADVVQLVGVKGDRQSRLLRRGEERPHVIDVEDALLDERIDRLGELLIDHLRNRADRLSDDPGSIDTYRRGEGTRRVVHAGDYYWRV